MKTLVVKGGTIVTGNNTFKGDIIIENGLIKDITGCNEMVPEADTTVINADGLYVFPGIIDDQVHFREPGATQKATVKSESIAAILGGVTSYMDMPNNIPAATSNRLVNEKYSIAERDSYANYSFYLGATNDNIEEIVNVDTRRICGVKVFMGSSTGNMLVDSDDALNTIFSRSPIIVATHCEDEGIIRRNMDLFKEQYASEIPFEAHPDIRSREACIKSTQKAIELAKRYNTRLHILHLSTADEIEMIKRANDEGFKNITGEICVHYLLFNRDDYREYKSKIKCNPAIKERSDMLALRDAVRQNIIKVVATDHAPHLLSEKENEYLKAPSGLPTVQHSFQLMMELVKSGVLEINDIPRAMSEGPAEAFNILKRGRLEKGYYADILIADILHPDKSSTRSPAYKCGWSPFADREFSTSIKYTILNGEIVVKDGKITGVKSAMPLEFDR